MSDNTYQDLNVNDVKTVQITVYRDTGEPFVPSGAFYKVNGSIKDNPIIPRTPASINFNKVYTKIEETVTASAGGYDLIWELKKDDGTTAFHCTKVSVNETC